MKGIQSGRKVKSYEIFILWKDQMPTYHTLFLLYIKSSTYLGFFFFENPVFFIIFMVFSCPTM